VTAGRKGWLTKKPGDTGVQVQSVVLSLITGAVFVSPNLSNAQHSVHVPGELLIGPKADVSDLDLEDQYKAHDGKKIKMHSKIKVQHIKVPEHSLEAVEAALRNNPKVEFVEKNFLAESTLAPNDPSYLKSGILVE
jgi:hypothetical protein